jgi:hypothetical protein
VKASNTGPDDEFGGSLALSADGGTLAVGASFEDSNSTGIDGDQGDSTGVGVDSGAAYVFVRVAQTTWEQQAYVKASNTGLEDNFGVSLTLSDDGDTLAIGASLEDSNAKGIDGNQGNSTGIGIDSGAVYLFARDEAGEWSSETYVKASNTETSDTFGNAVALSGDGGTLAVAAFNEDGRADGISHDADGPDQTQNGALAAGAVYVY